jgi:hypothetical protein
MTTKIPTKPRRKAKTKAKRKRKARMITCWAFTWLSSVNWDGETSSGVSAMKVRLHCNEGWHALSGDGYICGPITRIQLPAPAGEGGGA